MKESPYRSLDDRFPFVHTFSMDGKAVDILMVSDRSWNWYSNAVSANKQYLDMLEPGMTVVDLGSNEGVLAILAAIKVGPRGLVLAIEPARHNIELIGINRSINGLRNIVVFKMAAGDVDGNIPFAGECATADALDVVRSQRLDTMEFEPDVIKIDVEGFEAKAIRGARKTLESFKPDIFLEAHLSNDGGINMRQHGETPEGLLQLVTELGYEIFRDGVKVDSICDGAQILRHPKRVRRKQPVQMPKIYCITLASTPERINAAREHFTEIGLDDVEFVEGIDGRAFSLSTQRWSGELKWSPELNSDQPYYCSSGQIGLTLSHRFVWQLMRHSGVSEAIILEDDAIFEDDFIDKFKHCYAQLPADWQFCYVGAYDMDPEAPRVAQNVVIDKPYRTHAYMVRASALDVLISSMQSSRNHIDVLLRSLALPQLQHYCFRPSLAKQRTAEGHWESVAK